MIAPQQPIPSIIDLPPVFMSFIISELMPMAAIAIIIKNLLNSLSGVKISFGTPSEGAKVVIIEVATK